MSSISGTAKAEAYFDREELLALVSDLSIMITRAEKDDCFMLSIECTGTQDEEAFGKLTYENLEDQTSQREIKIHN